MRLPILILTLVFFLSSCEKELDFKYHDVESQIVIEATLSEEGSTVSISQTIPMEAPLKITQLTDALVSIKDITENSTYNLTVDEMGIFYGGTPGIPGHEYNIEVSSAGKYYFSSCTMRQPSRIISLDFQWIKSLMIMSRFCKLLLQIHLRPLMIAIGFDFIGTKSRTCGCYLTIENQ